MDWRCYAKILVLVHVVELLEINQRYPLNAHVEALLGIRIEFRYSFDDDIPLDEDNLCASSNVNSDADDELNPKEVGDDTEANDGM